MASRNVAACLPDRKSGANPYLYRLARAALAGIAVFLYFCSVPARAQYLLRPAQPEDRITLLPSDMAIFESADGRRDLPCTVTPRRPELGFDLRFHSGYDVTLPMNELSGEGQSVTILFRIYPQGEPGRAAYFLQRFHAPAIEDDAKGDAFLQGGIDLGEGSYHVDWLMRDGIERICSTNWDFDVALPPKDKPMALLIRPNELAESTPEPFVNDTLKPVHDGESLNVRLLVNFAPEDSLSATMPRSDADALVSILKAIQRDPRVGHISLVAFNIGDARIIYRQDTAEQIDFPALGRALQTVKLGTVDLRHLEEKHSETNFLESLIEHEMGTSTHPDAVIFAGPKARLDANVPQDDLRRIGNIECPVFYLNYNPNPQATPWKDSISHAIRVFKGTEYTISRPRDLWLSTTEMVSRIVRLKREKAVTASTGSGARQTDGSSQ